MQNRCGKKVNTLLPYLTKLKEECITLYALLDLDYITFENAIHLYLRRAVVE